MRLCQCGLLIASHLTEDNTRVCQLAIETPENQTSFGTNSKSSHGNWAKLRHVLQAFGQHRPWSDL